MVYYDFVYARSGAEKELKIETFIAAEES